MTVHHLTTAEIVDLQTAGIDVGVAQVSDRQGLDPATQAAADHLVAVMEADPVLGFGIFRQTTAMLAWTKLLMKALALHPVYEAATLARLGEGVADDAFDVPLDLGRGRLLSAREAMTEARGREYADRVVGDYLTFIRSPLDEWGRLMFRGIKDGHGVRNRAAVASDLVLEHLSRSTAARSGLVSASLACGAAGPVYRLVDSIESTLDARVDRIVLLDIDPMALASARSLARGTSAESRITLLQQNLLRPPLAGPRLPAHSVHIADALGLIEYLPEAQAVDLLTRVRTELMAPGGVVVFGNMLQHRYQTDFLEQVVGWPRLLRRSIGTMLAILRAAGYDTDQVTVRVTPDGVYAVYAVSV